MSKRAAKKKTEAEAEPEPTVIRDCYVKLTADQIADRAREMTDLMTSITEAEQAQKDEHKRRAIIIAGLKASVSALHRTIQSGRELQPVECSVTKDFAAKKAKISRLDTGELVETRDLTEEETAPKLALVIPMPPQPPPPAKEIDVKAAVEGLEPVPDRPQPKLSETQQLQADQAKWAALQDRAVEIIRETRRASLSTIQRRLPCRPETAIALMDALQARGIVGPPQGEAPREILQLPEPAPAT